MIRPVVALGGLGLMYWGAGTWDAAVFFSGGLVVLAICLESAWRDYRRYW